MVFNTEEYSSFIYRLNRLGYADLINETEKIPTRFVVTCFRTLKTILSFYLKNDNKFSQP